MTTSTEPKEMCVVLYKKKPEGSPKTASPQPKQKATVQSLASDPAPSKSTFKRQRKEAILDRIRKCLDRGRHPTIAEAEARTALQTASKLMKDHNLTEAQTFAESGTAENDSPTAGESVVSVTHVEGKIVQNHAFTGPLMRAMDTFFDCKSYHTGKRTSHEYIFYGVSKSTAAAAMAFEMCYNLILNWSLVKIGISVKHSYCLGVANGLVELANREQTEWAANETQLILADGRQVAEDYLKAQNMRLRKSRRGTSVKNLAAYKDGKKDSKKIDIRGKRLE